jgi:hypothetical protein
VGLAAKGDVNKGGVAMVGLRTGVTAGGKASWALRAAVAVAAVATAGIFASGAQAFHIPGAQYTGTHSGGGTVQLNVSSEGDLVTLFRVNNVPGNGCTLNFAQHSTPPNAPISIANNAFSDPVLPLTWNGSFNAPQSAQGVFAFSQGGCSTATLTFNVRTTSSSLLSPECIAATAAVKNAKKKFNKSGGKKAKRKLRRKRAERATFCGS